MALEMSNATYGRGTQEKDHLKSIVQAEMDRYAASLKGKSYENLVNTVKKYWSGVDEGKFLLLLDNNVSSLQKKVTTTYKNQLTGAIEDDFTQFLQTQYHNTTLIK